MALKYGRSFFFLGKFNVSGTHCFIEAVKWKKKLKLISNLTFKITIFIVRHLSLRMLKGVCEKYNKEVLLT